MATTVLWPQKKLRRVPMTEFPCRRSKHQTQACLEVSEIASLAGWFIKGEEPRPIILFLLFLGKDSQISSYMRIIML